MRSLLVVVYLLVGCGSGTTFPPVFFDAGVDAAATPDLACGIHYKACCDGVCHDATECVAGICTDTRDMGRPAADMASCYGNPPRDCTQVDGSEVCADGGPDCAVNGVICRVDIECGAGQLCMIKNGCGGIGLCAPKMSACGDDTQACCEEACRSTFYCDVTGHCNPCR